MKARRFKLILMCLFALGFCALELQAEGDTLIHGYGETHYGYSNKGDDTASMDQHRFVIGVTHMFNDKLSLSAEVDFEHAAQEMELEFAHIDFAISDAVNLRAGTILMPVGPLNEFHEPPLFYSVERPYVQKYVIPTSWPEGGAGMFGSLNADLKYRVYLIGGLAASKFKAKDGIRSGRQKVAESSADDIAVVGRLEYSGIRSLQLGGSYYKGNAGQDNAALGNATVKLIEADCRFRKYGLELSGLYSQIDISDTDKIYAVTGAEAAAELIKYSYTDKSAQVIGKKIIGWNAEVAYHLGELFMPGESDLVLFVRREQFNTQEEVVSTLAAAPKYDKEVTTMGIAYYPILNIAVKADLESWKDGTDATWEQLNFAVAYMY